jgi:hypothetical protein
MTAWLWRDERFDSLLDSLLAAILMAWRYCGRLPVVLLVNRETPSLLQMARQWGLHLQVEPHIKGGEGNVKELNRYLILNLAKWVDTKYVLSFQNHAFPIRTGLNDFLEKYDYIGAPWVFGKDDWITRFLLRHRGDVGNGGFALRSRRLCYRKTIQIAPPEVAATFSLEDNVELHESIHASPFGFHGPSAFAYLQREGKIPDLTIG